MRLVLELVKKKKHNRAIKHFLINASNYSMQLILKAAGFFITKTENI